MAGWEKKNQKISNARQVGLLFLARVGAMPVVAICVNLCMLSQEIEDYIEAFCFMLLGEPTFASRTIFIPANGAASFGGVVNDGAVEK